MTGMPQLVAALHSFVGLAAVFIGINSSLQPPINLSNVEVIIHEVEIFLGVFIGLTGVAFEMQKTLESISSNIFKIRKNIEEK